MRYVPVAAGQEQTVLLASERQMKRIATACKVARDKQAQINNSQPKEKRDAREAARIPFLRVQPIDYAWTLARAIKGYVWLQSARRDRDRIFYCGAHFIA